MFFKFEPPSVSSIRAKFLIERLNEISSSFSSISLCATGRTGSGKTTLGNRLIGIDYFMPSTGEQDCTDEVNLVEFPNGLKYFDLPGVASKGKLENYNRVALGIEQRGKFQNVDNLTLSQYKVGCEPRKNIFTAFEFRQRQILEPDIILYIIAPDKQFLDVDCLYLGDLLSQYSQIIYVFNMFADKQTGTIYATEQNIKDVTTRIREVHNFVLGKENQPIIVPVNCWTGEGLSSLVLSSCEILGSEKGKLFKELINYQQHKTPNEYIHQVKERFIDILAYASCQKPEGSYTCDQPIHKACYHLLEFLVNLDLQSKQLSASSDNWVKRVIDEALSLDIQEIGQSFNTSLEEAIYFIHDGFDSIQHGIDILNQLINVNLVETYRKTLEIRDKATIEVASDIEHFHEQINILGQQANSEIEKYQLIEEEIICITQEIDNCQETRELLINEFNSLNQQLGSRIDKYNAYKNSLRSFISDLDSRIDRYNFRIEKLNTRISAIKSAVNRLEASPYRVSESARSSLQSEIEYVKEEEDFLETEKHYLDEFISQRNLRISRLENDENFILQIIEELDEIKRNINYEEDKIKRKEEQGIAKLKLQQSVQEAIQNNLKFLSEQYKHRQEAIEFGRARLDYFNEELEIIRAKIDSRIEDINSRLESIRNEYASLLELEDVSQKEIGTLREKLNDCLEEIQSFNHEIACFQRYLQICSYKISISKLISDVLRECTTHHFDSTSEFEYRGSTYHCFNEKGLNIVLSLIYLFVLDNEVTSTFSSLSANVSRLLSDLGYFPNNSDTTQVTNWLKPRIGKLLPTSFDEILKCAIL